LSKTEKPLSAASDKVKEDLSEVPAKSGLAGTLMVILIITGIVGIVVLGIFLLTRR
jgi:cytoskeletal protein RodZ